MSNHRNWLSVRMAIAPTRRLLVEIAAHPAAARQRMVAPKVTTSGRVYGCFLYPPSAEVFVAVNSVIENVFIYRLSTSSGSDS
jgi:hypothetical protein